MLGTRSEVSAARLWLIVASAAVAAVFGAIGFAEYLPTRDEFADATGSDIAYYTAQLFVLSPTPLERPGPLNGWLEIARFLAPLTTILAVIEAVRVLLRDRIRAWVAAHSRGHAVVTGDSPAAVAIARRLAETRRVVLIGSLGAADLIRRHRVLVVAGDPADEATLRASGVQRAATVYTCAPDSARNAAVALVARKLTREPLAVYAQVRDGELVTALRARRLGSEGDAGFRLDFFALDELAARVLLDEHPPRPPDGGAASVAIVGFGSFARAVLLELVRRHHHGACRLSVTVVTGDSDAVREFRAAHALVARGCDLVDEPSVPAGGVTQLYVCASDTEETLRIGLGQLRAGTPLVVMCLGQRSAFGDALAPAGVFDDARGKLAVFGILDAACDPELLEHDLVDRLARALHERYLRTSRAQGDTPATNRYLRPWAELPPEIKRSNYQQAEHVGVKLDAIDAVVVPAVHGSEPFGYRDGELTRLAKLEHDRWVTEKRAQGVEYGPQRVEGRFHPDLRRWEDLPQASRDKDLDFVAHLPELLAGNGLDILRL